MAEKVLKILVRPVYLSSKQIQLFSGNRDQATEIKVRLQDLAKSANEVNINDLS